MRTFLLKAAVVAAAICGGGSVASAGNAFDGSWSVTMNTSGGSCSAFTSFPIHIANGVIAASGGGFNLRGRVSPSGVVRVTAVGTNQVANASGRLSMRSGGGSWSSRPRRCVGRWTAVRS